MFFSYLAPVRRFLPKIILLSIGILLNSIKIYAQKDQSQYKDNASELLIPTEEKLFKDDPDPVVMSAQIAVRLKKIQKTIPLDYNEHVQKFITFNVNRKEHVAKVLGRSKKYFPIYEPILAQYGVPDEMKYLSVVESALNPFATSPRGAAGPWQFMYSTAQRFELEINKRFDERRDPYKSCEAACRYLKYMYNLYGSWQLAIASYNCGPGNVNKAIKKAGGSKNFWDIRPYLPAETRAYVPMFIATVYAMKYASQYGIAPMELSRENTQRVTVKDKISLNDLVNLIGIPKQTIIDENPSLLTTLIPAGFTLNIPNSKYITFNKYQDSMYINALDMLTAQKLDLPKVIKPESTPTETNCETEPVTDYSSKPITKQPTSKEEPVATKSQPANADNEKSFFTKLKEKFTTKKEEPKPLDTKPKPKTQSLKDEPPATVKVVKESDKKQDKTQTDKQKNEQNKNKTITDKKQTEAEKKKAEAEKKQAETAKNNTQQTKSGMGKTATEASTNTTLKSDILQDISKQKNYKLPDLIKEDDDNYKVITYTVKDGDNLGYIAHWFHCKVKDIRRWNELNGNFIDVDDELLIYVHKNDYKKFTRFNYLSLRMKEMLSAEIQTQEEKDAEKLKEQMADTLATSAIQQAKTQTPPKQTPVPQPVVAKQNCFEEYTIKQGENLWTVARKKGYGSVKELMEWNNFKQTPTLHKGDKIKARKIAC